MTAKIFEYSEIIEKFPSEVREIFSVFNSRKPDSVRLVGGCVRDLLLEKNMKDFDFATKFLPDDTIQILEENNIKAIPTGVKYGTITAVINHKHFEITTLRKDVENDGRHPKTEFVDDYFFDAKRRDFTINALYLDESGKIYDYFDGISDLKGEKVKFIGDENLRIQEDFLRILRFFRFSIFYAKTLDVKGLEACVKNKKGLEILSAERIYSEFFKFFETSNNEKLLNILEIIEKNQIRSEIFSAKFQTKNLEKLLEFEKKINEKFAATLKFASLVFSKEVDLRELFIKLSFSNADKKYFNFLFEKFLNISRSLENQDLKELLCFERKDFVRDFYILQNSQNENHNFEIIAKNLNFIDNFILPEFPLNGDDLLKLGLSGAAIGETLLTAKKIWIKSDFALNKEELLQKILI